MKIDIIIGDGAYSGKGNLKNAKTQNIKVFAKLKPVFAKGQEKKKVSLSLIKMQVCLFAPQDIWQ